MIAETGPTPEDGNNDPIAALYDQIHESETALFEATARWANVPSVGRLAKFEATAQAVVSTMEEVVEGLVDNDDVDVSEKAFILADIFIKSDNQRVEYYKTLAPAEKFEVFPTPKEELQDSLIALLCSGDIEHAKEVIVNTYGTAFTGDINILASSVCKSRKAKLLNRVPAILGHAEDLTKIAAGGAAAILIAQAITQQKDKWTKPTP